MLLMGGASVFRRLATLLMATLLLVAAMGLSLHPPRAVVPAWSGRPARCAAPRASEETLEFDLDPSELDDTPTFCVNVVLRVKAERRDEFLEVIRNNQLGTLRDEALALVYVWGEDVDTPNTFHFHEQYLGRAGFEAHQKTPHFARWEEFAATDPFTAPPEVTFFNEDEGLYSLGMDETIPMADD
ncbi:hypothetical protein AB1Y20_019493 [Prymnesium parvum]|uniref:ABM domain-containing protein n=1 Tax=Prymnesium parvum TaxID=97485 RepID=A0AB34JW10_PRYPA|mmetsp:Transcript_6929/g.17320  ORF Transcript_6929/g.17320 Transcript_6929/m.17320 type:complete len:185 (-) Transcript_6929:183-737(-)